MNRLILIYRQAFKFVTYDIWHLRQTRVNASDAALIRLLKVLLISVRGFFADNISLRASALTFYTLIAVVPVLALLMGIARGFGLQPNLESWLHSTFAQQEQLLEFLLTFSKSMLESAKGGVFTGVSVLFLLWAVLNLLNNIEISFNHIWQARRNRPWLQKFTSYLSVALITPVFLILSSSITVALHRHVMDVAESLNIYSYVAPVAKLGFKFLSLALLWLMFTFIYVAMPYTRVKFAPALVGGVVAGLAFLLVQNFYIYSQMMVSKYSAIYGSFAAIPLFLLWAQLSWLILLFGAKLSFAIQNVRSFEHEQSLAELSLRQRKQLTLQLAHAVVCRFAHGEPPLSSSALAQQLNLPLSLTRAALHDLSQCKVLCEVITDDPKENAYQPALDIHAVTVGLVLSRIENQGMAYDADLPPEVVGTFANLVEQYEAGSMAGIGGMKVMEIANN